MRDFIGAIEAQRQAVTLAELEQARFIPFRSDARDDRDLIESMRTQRNTHRAFDRIGARASIAADTDREPHSGGRIHASNDGFHVRFKESAPRGPAL